MERHTEKIVNLLAYRAERLSAPGERRLPFDATPHSSFTSSRLEHRQRMLEHLLAAARNQDRSTV